MSEVRETHISIVVFLGDQVLKLRKPVRFDFIDLTTPEARFLDCKREISLNSRLAPDVYLGIANISVGNHVIDHAVLMRRLPADRSLAYLVTSSPQAVPNEEIRQVAQVLAAFHVRAARSELISRSGTASALFRRFEADVAATGRFVGSVLPVAVHEELLGAVSGYLSGRAALFEERIAEGQICDGHGDLQADDVFCLDDGPRIIDCLQFDEQLRYGDVVADVAFLAMDLERLGNARAARTFVEEYEKFSGTLLPASLLSFWCALRAYVRVKVMCLRHESGEESARGEANRLLGLALRHARRATVRLVLVGGLPGSGKSTLARGLSEALGFPVLRTDEIRRARKDFEREPPSEAGFRRGRYGPEETDSVYRTMLGRAARYLNHGQSVILDASWTEDVRRRLAVKLARGTSSELVELRCAAPSAVRDARISERLRVATDESEATVEVGRSMAEHEDPWRTATTIDTTGTVASTLALATESVFSGAFGPTS